MKIAKDGIREESLIVDSVNIHGFSHERGVVYAEAVVKLIDVTGGKWEGSTSITIPVKLLRVAPPTPGEKA